MFKPSQRDSIIAEAEAWLKTPYRSNAAVKGAGADCALFPLAVYTAVLGIDAPPVPKYVQQWHLNRGEEVYLNYVRGLGATEVDTPQTGDFALWRVGRVYSHGAIVTEWPRIIHAVNPRGVIRADASIDDRLRRAPVLFFTF